MKSMFKLMSEFSREISSLTLIPVAYKSSSIALSLICLGVLPEGCSRSKVTSFFDKMLGIFFSILGAFKSLATSSSQTCEYCKKANNALTEATLLEIEALAKFSSNMESM